MMDKRERHSAKLEHFVGPVTESPLASIRDVLICTTGGSTQGPDEARAHPPVASSLERALLGVPLSVDLGRNLALKRLSNEDSDLVMNACSRRGHHFAPIRQFGQRYALVRQVDPSEWDGHAYHWDREGVVYDALSMARLVRDNGFSTEYAARIVDFTDHEQIVAYRMPWEGDHAYRVRRDRDWLDHDEGLELRELLAAYWTAGGFSPRVSRAMWRCEYASWIRWGDVILPTLVSGLEALVKTRRQQVTRQFMKRVAQLARIFHQGERPGRGRGAVLCA